MRADLAVSLMLAGTEPPFLEQIVHNGALPELPTYSVNLYVSDLARGRAEEALVELVRDAYRSDGATASSLRLSPSISAA